MMTVEQAKSRIREAIESERDGALEAVAREVMPALPLEARQEVADWFLTARADLAEQIHHSDPDLSWKIREHVGPGETIADAWDNIPAPLQRQYTAAMQRYLHQSFRALPDPVTPVSPETYRAIMVIAFDLDMPEPDYAAIRERIRRVLLEVTTALPAGEARQRTQGALLDAVDLLGGDCTDAMVRADVHGKVYGAMRFYPTTTERGDHG